MMEKELADYFRTQLEKERDQVLRDLNNHLPSSDPIADLEEKADRAADNLVETRITESEGNLLQKIEFAFERLASGTYQRCHQCGEEIPLARLKAKPSVSLCLDCQDRKDKGRLQTS